MAALSLSGETGYAYVKAPVIWEPFLKKLYILQMRTI